MRTIEEMNLPPVQIECTCREWWGPQWADSRPYVIDARPVRDPQVPNAPVTIYVLTHDALEAAQLLRLAADKLEREPELLRQKLPHYAPVYGDDGEELPF